MTDWGRARSGARGLLALLRNLLCAAVVYGLIYLAVSVYQTGSPPSLRTKPALGSNAPSDGDSVAKPSWMAGTPPAHFKPERINANANWYNRPQSLIKMKHDFMGKRPDVDTVANLTKLVETCRGSYEKFERMENRFDCMKYLVDREDDYFYIPAEADRASSQTPKDTGLLNADGKENTLDSFPSSKAASKSSRGRCHGPIIPYHVYWTGAATWRVEVFIKAYLFTQNIPCSQVWLWLDTDKDPNAVNRMLTKDALFARFLPLVERGDIELHEWKFPSRIPLPRIDNTDGIGYYPTPGRPNAAGEFAVADGLIRDVNGQEWLALTDRQKTFLPVAISDAVRFIVLHSYGGAYFDMDVILLRDMRPLIIGPDNTFAERWGQQYSQGDYNTAVLSLKANSSLSSYLLRGGVRMGMNFHPRVVGMMAMKDGRDHELKMLETSTFDPIWWENGGYRPCTAPCLRDYTGVFKAKPFKDEWEAYDGPEEEHVLKAKRQALTVSPRVAVSVSSAEVVHTFDPKTLAKMPYKIEQDNYPPQNRSIEHFFRGSWAYHVHNSWARNPEPSSWFDVIRRAHNDFFAGARPNPYGEKWYGPKMLDYELCWEFV